MPLGNKLLLEEENILVKGEEYLIFRLGDETYIVPLRYILEIKSLDSIQIFSISNAPPYMKGIIEIHEKVVPIVDLKVVYSNAAVEHGKKAVLIILEVGDESFGIIVDSIADIITLQPDQIKDPPEYYSKQFIKNVGAIEHNLYLILDVVGLVQSKNLEIMHHARERK